IHKLQPEAPWFSKCLRRQERGNEEIGTGSTSDMRGKPCSRASCRTSTWISDTDGCGAFSSFKRPFADWADVGNASGISRITFLPTHDYRRYERRLPHGSGSHAQCPSRGSGGAMESPRHIVVRSL